MTRQWLVVVVALLAAASGCVGLGGGPDAGPVSGTGGSDGASGGGSSGGGTTADTGDGGDDASADRGGDSGAGAPGFQPATDFEDIRTDAQMTDYIDRSPFPVFRPGEYFAYEGTNRFGEEPVPVEMEIRSVEGGEWLDADLEVTLTKGGETNTYRAADGSIGRILLSPELALTQNGRGWVWLYRYNLVTNVDPRISELSVGETWRYDSPSQEADDEPTGFAFEVTGERRYAGQSCLVVETYSFEGETSRLFSETCLTADIGMPLYYAMYQDDGELLLEMELIEYQR